MKAAIFAAEAVAWKSDAAKALTPPKAPLRMSTSKAPRMLNGLLPTGAPDCLILSVTDWMTALSGRPVVSKDRMDLYCRFKAVSPNLKVVAVELKVPPLLLASVDSSLRTDAVRRERLFR